MKEAQSKTVKRRLFFFPFNTYWWSCCCFVHAVVFAWLKVELLHKLFCIIFIYILLHCWVLNCLSSVLNSALISLFCKSQNMHYTERCKKKNPHFSENQISLPVNPHPYCQHSGHFAILLLVIVPFRLVLSPWSKPSLSKNRFLRVIHESSESLTNSYKGKHYKCNRFERSFITVCFKHGWPKKPPCFCEDFDAGQTSDFMCSVSCSEASSPNRKWANGVSGITSSLL